MALSLGSLYQLILQYTKESLLLLKRNYSLVVMNGNMVGKNEAWCMGCIHSHLKDLLLVKQDFTDFTMEP